MDIEGAIPCNRDVKKRLRPGLGYFLILVVQHACLNCGEMASSFVTSRHELLDCKWVSASWGCLRDVAICCPSHDSMAVSQLGRSDRIERAYVSLLCRNMFSWEMVQSWSCVFFHIFYVLAKNRYCHENASRCCCETPVRTALKK